MLTRLAIARESFLFWTSNTAGVPAARILEARQLSPKQHCLIARTTTTRYHAINDLISL